jgi:hypothetical protein
MEQRSLFGLLEHLERISKVGDPLEVLEAMVDFEHPRLADRRARLQRWRQGWQACL